jgi:hypothetical protein
MAQTDERVDTDQQVRCGMCGAPGRLVLYTTGRLDARFECSCRQRWYEQGRSPWLGMAGPYDREQRQRVSAVEIYH